MKLRLALGALLLALPAFAQYHSNDLTPPASTAAKLLGASKGKQVGGGSNNHAYLMTGNSLTAVDLHPPVGHIYSVATSTDDVDQCGYAYSNLGGIHAMKWSGSNSSSVDMQPSGYNFSYCTGVDNGEQGGFAEQQSYAVTASHAMLWHGSSAATDMHPISMVGYFFSRILGVKSGEQVGYVSSFAYPYGDNLGYHTTSQAVIWHETAASAVSLHPVGYDASEALATNGTQQGGWALRAIDAQSHAILWTGTAASAVDLHPAGYTASRITAIYGNQQVGEGWVGVPGAAGSVRHALVWTGTPESVVDLNQFLPIGYTNGVATGMDVDGNVVGFAYNSWLQGIFVGGDAIAVVFAPGPASPTALSSLTADVTSVAPGGTLNVTVSLGTAAPAGGISITFLSNNVALAGTPAAVTIPEGQTSATVPVSVLGSTLAFPTSFRLFASDGTVSKSIALTVKPVVNLTGMTVNAVEGGFSTYGSIVLSIPAQTGGATISLTSGNPALAAVPASVTVPAGYTSYSFSIPTTAVAATTTVPITATFNDVTLTSNVTISAAPEVSLSALTLPASVVGGQTLYGTVTLNNFVRSAAGATVLLSTGDTTTVQLPASVFIPQGAWSGSFAATTAVVPGNKGVSIKATFDGAQLSSTVTVAPIPPVTILTADYKASTQILKVTASSPDPNVILTWGANGVAFGTMQLELGVYQGAIVMANPPATITVWSSVGGSATMAVTTGASSGGGVGGGGGGGNAGGGGAGGTTTNFTLSVKSIGFGTVTSSPAGINCTLVGTNCSVSLASGSSITLTAAPAAGVPWKGWGGDCLGTSLTCVVNMSKAKSVTATFK